MEKLYSLDRVSLIDRLARAVPFLGLYFLYEKATLALKMAEMEDQAFVYAMRGMDVKNEYYSLFANHSVKSQKYILKTIITALLISWLLIPALSIYGLPFWLAVTSAQLFALGADYTSCSVMQKIWHSRESKKMPKILGSQNCFNSTEQDDSNN